MQRRWLWLRNAVNVDAVDGKWIPVQNVRERVILVLLVVTNVTTAMGQGVFVRNMERIDKLNMVLGGYNEV